jgi:hypothetical protein
MVGTKHSATQYWDACIFLALLKQETTLLPGELDY